MIEKILNKITELIDDYYIIFEFFIRGFRLLATMFIIILILVFSPTWLNIAFGVILISILIGAWLSA